MRFPIAEAHIDGGLRPGTLAACRGMGSRGGRGSQGTWRLQGRRLHRGPGQAACGVRASGWVRRGPRAGVAVLPAWSTVTVSFPPDCRRSVPAGAVHCAGHGMASVFHALLGAAQALKARGSPAGAGEINFTRPGSDLRAGDTAGATTSVSMPLRVTDNYAQLDKSSGVAVALVPAVGPISNAVPGRPQGLVRQSNRAGPRDQPEGMDRQTDTTDSPAFYATRFLDTAGGVGWDGPVPRRNKLGR